MLCRILIAMAAAPRLSLALALFALLAGPGPARADFASPCGPARFVGPHGLGNEHVYRGTMTAACSIRGAGAGGIARLLKHYQETTLQKNVINRERVADRYKGLAGFMYDVTDHEEDPARSDLRLVGDNRSRFIYASASKEVKCARTWACPIARRTEIAVDLAEPGTYALAYTISLEVEVYRVARMAPGIDRIMDAKFTEKFSGALESVVAEVSAAL